MNIKITCIQTFIKKSKKIKIMYMNKKMICYSKMTKILFNYIYYHLLSFIFS